MASAGKHFVARQPILDHRLKIYAYELLFRSGLENFFDQATDGDKATKQVISDSFLLFGIEKMTGRSRAFINFTRNLLVQGYPALLPKQYAVVEILENVEPDREVIKACVNLKKRGYLLALDDFVYHAKYEPLLKMADIIKVDFRISGPEERAELARHLADYPLRLLAEKVETKEEFDEGVALGYELFQGYFFAKPVLVSHNELPSIKLQYLRMLQELNRPELSYTRLSEIISGDLSLSYKLLRYLNSAAFGLRHEVTNIRQALAMLGEKEIRKWCSLLTLHHLGQDKPQELVVASVVRAKLAELIAQRLGMGDKSGDMFLMGLFSLLDAICGLPLEELLRELPLSEEVRRALLQRSGIGGSILKLLEAQERGDWQEISRLAAEMGLDESRIPELYVRAVLFPQEILAA